ncbi:LrgB family protein [Tuberibacillus sp. Marseille-P3662]|uniref:LrgB family protein n=1 Tax=Tuberibacillus sp. Marseille-P3662 TaxID=1965358 RepID=UPI000A1C9FC7|nr:LrgB family protein [Tuberibacillus sp. Marseille-P3662]
MAKTLMAVIIILLTITIYLCMNRIYQRFHLPFLIPALTTTLAIIVILVCFQVPYQTYMIGGHWINLLLGPAVVALAYPLYKQRKALVQHFLPILGGVLVGSIVGIMSGLLFAKSLGIAHKLILSLLPKSVTTPVAMQIASGIGGAPSLTAVFVMIAGFTGVTLGPYILNWFRISTFLGQGIAFGSASHAIGTSKAFEYGEDTASMSSVAMTLSAVSAAILGPLVVLLLYA